MSLGVKMVDLDRFLENSVEKSEKRWRIGNLFNRSLSKNYKISSFKNLQRPEAVAMLVSFPKNVHTLVSANEIPRYSRFSEKGWKTSKIRKLTR